MKKIKKWVSLLKRKINNYKWYIKNEIRYKLTEGGDPRDEFEKFVDKCRYLEKDTMIYHAQGGKGA